MKIRFLRVLGARSQAPAVVATVDGYLVKWNPRTDWSCDCDEESFPNCPHIPAVGKLLDPRVTAQPERTNA